MRRIERRWRLMSLWRTSLPTAVILVLGGAVTLGSLRTGNMGLAFNIVGDTQGAVPRRGEATVAATIPVAGTRFNPDPYSLTALHLAGRDVMFPCFVHVRVGERVRVAYRVGHSGRVYIDSLSRSGP